MIATGRLAYANARVRALKSRLLGPEIVRRLLRAEAPAPERGTTPAEAPFDHEGSDDAAALPARRFEELVACYRTILRSYPSGQPILLSVLRLHEIENVKLVWRAIVRSHPFERWGGLWRPLGSLQELDLEDCRRRTSLHDLSIGVRGTPYEDVVGATLRAHTDDLMAADLAFDHWASASLAQAADELPRAERRAGDLVVAMVRERDLELVRRGVRSYGLSPDAIPSRLLVLRRELPRDEIVRLASWTPSEGPFVVRRWPRSWTGMAGAVTGWDALSLTLRHARRDSCRRAFLGSPYCLAPAVALLLLKEEEVRGVTAVLEARHSPKSSAVLERALAGGLMGA